VNSARPSAERAFKQHAQALEIQPATPPTPIKLSRPAGHQNDPPNGQAPYP